MREGQEIPFMQNSGALFVDYRTGERKVVKTSVTFSHRTGFSIGDVVSGGGENWTVWDVISTTQILTKPYRWHHKYQLAIINIDPRYLFIIAGLIYILEAM